MYLQRETTVGHKFNSEQFRSNFLALPVDFCIPNGLHFGQKLVVFGMCNGQTLSIAFFSPRIINGQREVLFRTNLYGFFGQPRDFSLAMGPQTLIRASCPLWKWQWSIENTPGGLVVCLRWIRVEAWIQLGIQDFWHGEKKVTIPHKTSRPQDDYQYVLIMGDVHMKTIEVTLLNEETGSSRSPQLLVLQTEFHLRPSRVPFVLFKYLGSTLYLFILQNSPFLAVPTRESSCKKLRIYRQIQIKRIGSSIRCMHPGRTSIRSKSGD